MSEKPPIIGISGSSGDSASVRAMVTQIRDAGGIPLFLSNFSKRDPEKDIEKINALVVMGNNADIDPAKYGAAKHDCTQIETQKKDGTPDPEGIARAAYEEKIIEAALVKKIPFLGVCGGMQRLNVFLGGSLHQHVPDLTKQHDHAQQDSNIPPFIPVQSVDIKKDTTLAAIAGNLANIYVPQHGQQYAASILENSMHHQAVDRVADGLRVAAVSQEIGKDNNPFALTEAIEGDPSIFKDQFIMGVQWHPEFGASPLGIRLANRVVEEGKAHARAHPKAISMEEVIQENILSSLPVVREKMDKALFREGGRTASILAQKPVAAER